MKNTIKILGLLASLATMPLALAKPIPAGIVNLASGQITPTNTIMNLSKRPWTNPTVDGMRVKTQWNYVQPGENTYNWTGIDEAFRLGSQHSKFIGLSVGAGTSTPQWVYEAGATKYPLPDGSGLSMTIPWEGHFLDKWLAFVRVLGQRYDGNSALGYIVMSGMGQGIETYLLKSGQAPAGFASWQLTPRWVAATKRIIAVYAEAFPTTPFFITMAKPFPDQAGVVALQEVVTWGVAMYPGRFGLMNASLNANSNTGYYPNEAVYTYRIIQPTGFQLLCSESYDSTRLGGTLVGAAIAGYLLGGKFVEVYEPDVDLAKNQQLLASWGAALKSNH